MALLPHGFFPRSKFDTDEWFRTNSGLSTLDMFDPFDELDHMIGRNLNWLSRPDFMMPALPRVPHKYRITVDCTGYAPKSIKTEVNGHKLTVSGREEVKLEDGDFSIKEFKKTYDLPVEAETDKLVSFMTSHGHLVIEVPLKETNQHPHSDLFPHIVDAPNGNKIVQMKFNLPENVDPSKASVSIKDRDLIVRVEDKIEKPDQTSRYFYYKRTTLPENTEFDKIKCVQDKNQIAITAPLDMEYNKTHHRTVPIEHKKHHAITHK